MTVSIDTGGSVLMACECTRKIGRNATALNDSILVILICNVKEFISQEYTDSQPPTPSQV